MQKLIIKGKKNLSGTISVSGSKNATLPILAASILAKEVNLSNVPLVKDIFTIDYNIIRINENYYWINITASSPTFF